MNNLITSRKFNTTQLFALSIYVYIKTSLFIQLTLKYVELSVLKMTNLIEITTKVSCESSIIDTQSKISE